MASVCSMLYGGARQPKLPIVPEYLCSCSDGEYYHWWLKDTHTEASCKILQESYTIHASCILHLLPLWNLARFFQDWHMGTKNLAFYSKILQLDDLRINIQDFLQESARHLARFKSSTSRHLALAPRRLRTTKDDDPYQKTVLHTSMGDP